MIPIRLSWQRPVDGIEIVELASAAGRSSFAARFPDAARIGETRVGQKGKRRRDRDERSLVARSKRMEAVPYSIEDLEDPFALRLVNCNDDDSLVAFTSRFGIPVNGNIDEEPQAIPERMDVEALHSLKSTLIEILSLNNFPNSVEKAAYASQETRGIALHPSIEFLGNRNALVMRPKHFSELMMMEAIFAFEAGAVLTRCGHCDKAYLTGPLTKRRSHAVYCSDRCRVAAMRERNTKKASKIIGEAQGNVGS